MLYIATHLYKQENHLSWLPEDLAPPAFRNQTTTNYATLHKDRVKARFTSESGST